MKNNSTKKRTNLMQFTLTDEGIKILEQFSTKYGTSKSVIIDRALMFLAGQYHRKIIVSYELLTEDQDTTTTTIQNNITQNQTTKKGLSVNTDTEDVSDAEMDRIVKQINAMKDRAKRIEKGEL